MDSIRIACAERPLRARIRPPGSKSITNRALICAAAAQGPSQLNGVLSSEDTEVMIAALRRIGVQIEARGEDRLEVLGAAAKFLPADGPLFVANSGTTIRFLTALLAFSGGRYELDGVPRMRERPIEDLLTALRTLGVEAASTAGNGCPPVSLRSSGVQGGRLSIRGDVSSQFLSGMLMAAPLARGPVEIQVEGSLVSKPYVRMTTEVMRAFRGEVACDEQLSRFHVAPQSYLGCRYDIEPDASAASYFWAAAAIVGGEVTVDGLTRDALQGDVAFVDCLQSMGCSVREDETSITVARQGTLQGVDVDMNAISDTVQTLSAVALFADGPTRIRGVAHNRHKETDRIGDLARELRKLGASVEEHDDGLTITPGPLQAAEVETYRDHRMAMSLALVGLKLPDVVVLDPGCTAKTYPHYFDDLAGVTGQDSPSG